MPGPSWIRRSFAAIAAVGAAACTPAPGPAQPAPDTPTAPCATGELRDGDTCVPEACGVGPWGGQTSTDGVYVRADAPAGGDGTAEAPFATIADGLAAAVDRGGGEVYVEAGTYAENLVVPGTGAALRGRCAEWVTLDASGAELPGIDARGGNRQLTLAISGLTLSGGTLGIAAERSSLTIDAVVLADNVDSGIYAAGNTTVTLRDSVVRGTIPVGHSFGRGLSIEQGATLEAERVYLEDNGAEGIFAARNGTSLTLVDVELSGNVTDSRAGLAALLVADGAAVVADRLVVTNNHARSVLVQDGALSLTNSEVSATRPEGDGGHGIEVEAGGTLELIDTTLSGHTGFALLVQGEGTSAWVDGASVTRTAGEAPDSAAVWVQDGASVSLQDTELVDNQAGGLIALGAAVTLTDTTLSRTGIGEDVAYAVFVGGGTTLQADGLTLDHNHFAGLVAADAGTWVSLLRTRVSDTEAGADGRFGRGVWAIDGASLEADGLVVSASTEVGVHVEGSDATLHGGSVTYTRRGSISTMAAGVVASSGARVVAEDLAVEGQEGPGFLASDSGSLRCDRCTVRDNRYAGVLVLGGAAELTDTEIHTNLADASEGGGVGVYLGPGGPDLPRLDMEGGVVSGHPYAAVWATSAGVYEIRDSTLDGGPGVAQGGVVLHGNAVFAGPGVGAWDGATGLRLAGNVLEGSGGPAVFLVEASVDLEGNQWADNTIDLVQQGCESVDVLDESERDGATTTRICEGADLLYDTTLLSCSLWLSEAAPE